MRILYTLFVGIAVAAMYGCNDSSTSDNNATNESAGTPVVDNTDTVGQANRGVLGTIVDQADAGVHGKVVSIETIHSNDPNETPHQLVSIEINETLLGKYDDLSSGIIHALFVGGDFKDGERAVWASNNPEISVGDEVVALITERDNHPCTFTQCAKGVFKVRDGKVFADNGAVVAVNKDHDVRFISKRGQASGQYKNVIDASSLENFKSLITRLGNESNSKVKSKRVQLTKFDKDQPFVASPALTTPSVAPTTNEENAKLEAKQKEERAKYIATLSAKDQWELQAYEKNGRNPVLPNTYLGENQQ